MFTNKPVQNPNRRNISIFMLAIILLSIMGFQHVQQRLIGKPPIAYADVLERESTSNNLLPYNIEQQQSEEFSCTNVTQIPQTECEALVALYNSTDGDNWTTNTDWLLTTTPCSWHGITCSEAEDSIVAINLVDNSLNGAIPNEIDNLTQLTHLELSSYSIFASERALTGPIPASLGNLKNLITLELVGDLSGTIPNELGNLLNLTQIILGSELTGSIPVAFGNLTNLTDINLRGNQLTGELPVELGNLSKLIFLDLAFNEFTGPIPLSFINLTNLEQFAIAETNLCKSVNASFQNWLDGLLVSDDTYIISCEDSTPPLSAIPFDEVPQTLTDFIQRCRNEIDVPVLGSGASGYNLSEFATTDYKDILAEEVTAAICAAYQRNQAHLGAPVEGEEGEVHWWIDNQGAKTKYQVQNFCRKDSNGNIESDDNGGCKDNIIIYNPVVQTAFLVRGQIWDTYRLSNADGGFDGVTGSLGGPISDEFNYDIDQDTGLHNEARSLFENGQMTWRSDGDGTPVTEFYVDLEINRDFLDVPMNPEGIYDLQAQIAEIANAQITNGCADSIFQKRYFCPERFVTRVEIATFVARAIYGPNLPAVEPAGHRTFLDMQNNEDYADDNHDFVKAVEALAGDDIVKGDSQRNFNPNSFVTRSEAMSFIIRALMHPNAVPEEDNNSSLELDFKDVAGDSPHRAAIYWAQKFNFIDDSEQFKPDDFITRSDMAELLCNAFLGACDINRGEQQMKAWTYIAPGIKQRFPTGDSSQLGESIAIVDLDTPGIQIKLAYEFEDEESATFKLKSLTELVSATINSNNSPYVSINGTAFDKDCDQPASIFGINGVAYAQNRGKVTGVGASLFSHYFNESGKTNELVNIRSSQLPMNSIDGYRLPGELINPIGSLNATNKVLDEISKSQFVVGYGPTIVMPYKDENENIVGLYNPLPYAIWNSVASAEDWYNNMFERKTAIGVRYNNDGIATHLFFANLGAIIQKKGIIHFNNSFPYIEDVEVDVSIAASMLENFANHLRSAGAHHVILLDGGPSSQFKSIGRNGEFYSYVEEDNLSPPCDRENFSYRPRHIINAIVAYNDSTNLNISRNIASSGGRIPVTSRLDTRFDSNSFGEGIISKGARDSSRHEQIDNVTLNYAPVSPSYDGLQTFNSIGTFYELYAKNTAGELVQTEKPFEMIIRYDPDELPSEVDESTLALYFWNETDWEKEPTSVIDTNKKQISVRTDRFGTWGILAPKVEPVMINVTFNVQVPEFTSGPIYMTGNIPGTDISDPGATLMESNGDGSWSQTFSIPEGSLILYKYTRGNWATPENWGDISLEEMRAILVINDGSGVLTIDNTDTNWEDNPDRHKAIQNWYDPLVINTTPISGSTGISLGTSIIVKWSKSMNPESQFRVTASDNSLVDGKFAYNEETLEMIFTPAESLTIRSTYTVNVAEQVAADGAFQQVATTWQFTTDGVPTSLDIVEEPLAEPIDANVYLPLISR